MGDAGFHVPAETNGQLPPQSMDELIAAVAAKQEAAENDAVTIGDIAAAAFVALETIVSVLGGNDSPNGRKVIQEFEDRAARMNALEVVE